MVRSPTPFRLGRNGCWSYRGSQLPQALSFIFSLCCPLNDCRRAAHSFFKIGRLFSLFLFSGLSFSRLRLLILLLLLMRGNVHPNPGFIFPCSVCAENVTWQSMSVQCSTCSKWVHLRYNFPSPNSELLAALTLGAAPLLRPYSQYSNSLLGLLRPVYLYCTIWPSSADAAFPPNPRFQTTYSPSVHFVYSLFSLCSLTTVPCFSLSFYAYCFFSHPDSLKVLQWNAGGLRARSTELFHFLSSHPVDLICIQESNLISSSSFRIPEFFALRSDRTHSRSGILSPDATHAIGGVIIFFRQGLSFSELSIFSLALLDSYYDYIGINISLNNFSSLLFPNVYASLIRSSPTDSRTNSFSPSILSSSRNLLIL